MRLFSRSVRKLIKMFEALKEAAINWGYWMRKPPDGWPTSSPLMRIKEHGRLGGAIQSHRKDYSLISDRYITDPDALAFHQAWEQQNSTDQAILYVCFAVQTGLKKKVCLLKRAQICNSQTRMYEMRKDALYRIEPAWFTAVYGNQAHSRNSMLVSAQ